MEAGYDSDEQDDCDLRSRPVSFLGTQLGLPVVSLRRFNRQELLMTLRCQRFRRTWSVLLSGGGLFGARCELAFKRLDVPAVDAESGDDRLGNAQEVLPHVPVLLRSGNEAGNSGSDMLPELVLRMATDRTRVLFQRFDLWVHDGAFNPSCVDSRL